MICPIMSTAEMSHTGSLTTQVVPVECLREMCAWFYAQEDKCCVLDVAISLDQIRDAALASPTNQTLMDGFRNLRAAIRK